MKTIIFDLKNTLVAADGEFLVGAREAIDAIDSNTVKVLYTMNEQWTYGILAKYPDLWQRFARLIIVNKKQVDDLRPYVGKDALVVGDSDKEELAFANLLGLESIKITGKMPLADVTKFLKDRP